MALRSILYWLILCLVVHADQSFEVGETDGEIYTNSWAVQLDTHDESVADEVSASLGFKNHGTIANLPGYFKFEHEQTERRHRRSAEHHTQPLLQHPRVKWAQQQTVLFRYKRGFEALGEHISDVRIVRAEENKRYFNDPEWENQWYFGAMNADETRGNLGVLDAVRLGYTGKGVVVSIVDDGLDHAHPDLQRNYDPAASIDVNDNDDDPTPNVNKAGNDHGTKCGGEVAAEANNNVCGVGIAHDAKIGGIRMLDGPITDETEARALGFNCKRIDIYSASWGPKDDGKTFGKPQPLASDAMKKCIETGREGKGNLYVWATGNGGYSNDDCNCDGYTSMIHTLSVGSISRRGFYTGYDEKCPSTMAVVYTGDVGEGKRERSSYLITTSLFNQCVKSFSGTSCAAPLAAGIFALVLQAEPSLTWRDMQHLVVRTAHKNDPDGASWSTNAAGHKYSRSYGFGVLNAMSLINAAKEWTHVGRQLTYELPGALTRDTPVLPLLSKRDVELRVNNDKDDIRNLEHVQFMLSIDHRRRGDIVIDVTSPRGTTSRVLSKRQADDSSSGLEKWPFTTVEFWDENPKGEWIVKIRDEKSDNDYAPRKNIQYDEAESQQRDEPDLSHGRFKEDYMTLTARSFEEFPQRSEDDPSFRRELSHGRFKEDYMKLAGGSRQPSNVASDESDSCRPSGSLQGPIAGCVTEWSLVMYGTA